MARTQVPSCCPQRRGHHGRRSGGARSSRDPPRPPTRPLGRRRWPARSRASSAARPTGAPTARRRTWRRWATPPHTPRSSTVPAGTYEFKVAINHELGRELRRRTAPPTAPTSRWSSRARPRVRVLLRRRDAPGGHAARPSCPGRRDRADQAYAADSLREPLTKERYYFVMADRFANGSTAQRQGRADRRPAPDRARPDEHRLLPRRRPQGDPDKLDYIKGLGTTVDLADAVVQEPARAGRGAERQRRLPRLLDHRLHPGRPAPRHQRRPEGPDRRGPRQGHEGLLRHHHQPHRRRHQLPARTSTPTSTRRPTPYKDADGQRLRRQGVRRQARLPGAGPCHVVPLHARSSARPPTRPSRSRPGSTTARCYHNRGDSTFAGESSQVRRLRRARRPVHRAARGRARAWRTSTRPGSTSASTASGSTPSST